MKIVPVLKPSVQMSKPHERQSVWHEKHWQKWLGLNGGILPTLRTSSKDSVSRALLLLADKVQKPLVVQVAENKVTLEAATTAGEMSESINAVTEGESGLLRIGYNPRYLMEILQAIEDETIDLSLGGAKDPCLIKGMDYLYVLLPVSLGKTEAAL